MSLARQLFGASASIALAGMLAKSLAIFSAPLLTSLLGPEPYGVMALLTTLITLGATLSVFGIDLSYARFACTGRSDEDRRVEAFCWRFVVACAGGIGLLMAAIGAVRALFGLSLGVDLPGAMLAVTGAGVFMTAMDAMAQARKRLEGSYGRLAIALIIAAVLSTGLTIVLALFWRRDAWSMLLGYVAGSMVSVALLRIAPLALLREPSGLDGLRRRELVSFAFMGSATAATLYWIVSTSDRWFISAFLDHKSVGIYAFSCSIAYIGQMLNSAVLSAWRVESFKTFEHSAAVAQEVLGRLWSRIAVMLGLVWLAIAAAGGDVIRLLSHGDFHEGAAFVPWLAGAVFFYGLAHLANTGLLLGKNMRPWTLWWIAGAMVSLGLNLLFVRNFGALGAAIVQMISFAVIACGVMFSSQKTYPLRIRFRKLLAAVPAVGMTGLLMSVAWHPAPLVSLALKLPVGMIAAATASYYIAPDWFIAAVRRALRGLSR